MDRRKGGIGFLLKDKKGEGVRCEKKIQRIVERETSFEGVGKKTKWVLEEKKGKGNSKIVDEKMRRDESNRGGNWKV